MALCLQSSPPRPCLLRRHHCATATPPPRHCPTPSRLPAGSLPRLVPPPVDSTGYGPVIELIRKYEAGPIAQPFGGVDARAAVDAEGKQAGSNRTHNPDPEPNPNPHPEYWS